MVSTTLSIAIFITAVFSILGFVPSMFLHTAGAVVLFPAFAPLVPFMATAGVVMQTLIVFGVVYLTTYVFELLSRKIK